MRQKGVYLAHSDVDAHCVAYRFANAEAWRLVPGEDGQVVTRLAPLQEFLDGELLALQRALPGQAQAQTRKQQTGRRHRYPHPAHSPGGRPLTQACPWGREGARTLETAHALGCRKWKHFATLQATLTYASMPGRARWPDWIELHA